MPVTGRVLGVDFGERRVGLALSDPLGITAQPLVTLQIASLTQAVEEVARVAREEEAVLVVVGYPLLLSGEAGALARRVERFAVALEAALGIPVLKWDERLSSVQASRVVREEGKRRAPRGREDRVAASLILAAYLDRERARQEQAHPGQAGD